MNGCFDKFRNHFYMLPFLHFIKLYSLFGKGLSALLQGKKISTVTNVLFGDEILIFHFIVIHFI